MRQKTKLTKTKVFKLTLSEKECELLKLYAQDYNTTRPEALRRMVREALKEYKSRKGPIQPANQLGLFDALQMDIFDNASGGEE
ncbi:MAG: hypothetical protein MJZ67_06080 [Bacteroidales bacterium]|nr:hypothetical protein [Bacteroidales bacterium]